MSEITVVIVAYNSQDVIGVAIDSVVNNTNIKQCIIVNNSSNKLDIGLPKNTKIHVMEAEENLGFGRANNMALEQVTTPYAVLLNPDAFLQDGAIERLIECAEKNPDAAILSPLIFHDDGSVQKSYKKNVFEREIDGGNFYVPEGDMCAEFLSGSVMFLNMDNMKKIGFFDPKIFLFYEDDDICIRVKKAGYSLVLTPLAKACHVMGGASGNGRDIIYLKQYHMAWSRLYIEQKYHRKLKLLQKIIIDCGLFLIKWLGYTILFKASKSLRYRARLCAVVDFLGGKRWKGQQ